MPLHTVVYGNTLQQWLVAAGIAIAAYLAMVALRRLVAARLAAFAAHTTTPWDDLLAELVRRIRWFVLLAGALLLGATVLTLPARVGTILRTLFVLAATVQAGVWASMVARRVLDRYAAAHMETDRSAATMVSLAGFLVQCVLWSAVLLFALDNVGVNITALVAGLGIGGIAFALATQSILGDLFASLAIVLDKPFVLGDFVIVDDLLGTVEHIGLKTTRIRSLSGEQLIFANADLLKSRIRNYSRMVERRVVFTIRTPYDTPRAKIERVPTLIRTAIEAQQKTRFDRSHFTAYGDGALEYESVYFVLSADYNLYADIQQAINLAIHGAFETERIEFARASRAVYISERGPAANQPSATGQPAPSGEAAGPGDATR